MTPCLSFETLVAYWAGDETDGVEEHVFACDACARSLEAVAELARGVAAVAGRRGGAMLILTAPAVDRMAAQGLRLRHYRAAPGDVVACTVAPDDDQIVTWLTADFTGVKRVDTRVTDGAGNTLVHLEDTPVSGDRVIYTLAGDVARALPRVTLTVELSAVDDAGSRPLARYTFDHTPGASS